MAKPKKKTGRVKSRRVWQAWWDTGGMGGGGSAWVCEKGGWFFVRGTEDESGGPYPTLLAALKDRGLNRLPMEGVYMEITSTVLSSDELAATMDTDGADLNTGVLLNGEEWVYGEPDIFRRAENDEERDWVGVSL